MSILKADDDESSFEDDLLWNDDKELGQHDSATHFTEFTDEDDDNTPSSRWKVLVVDDEEDIHQVTKMVLSDFEYRGRGIELIHAYSGEESIDKMEKHRDVALIFMDVVMETEDAGLRAIRRIRDELGNAHVRIILRTGQPGQAPERQVITEYDINDYKAKTELTSQKLFSTTVSALRSWCDIQAIERSRRGLFLILESAGNFDFSSLTHYLAGLHTQFTSLLEVDGEALLIIGLPTDASSLSVLSASGNQTALIGRSLVEADLNEKACERIERAYSENNNSVYADSACYYLPIENRGVVLYFSTPKELDAVEFSLADIFCHKLMLAHENFNHLDRLIRERQALAVALASAGEPNHLMNRNQMLDLADLVTAITQRLLETSLTETEIDNRFLRTVGLSAILHDFGNVGLNPEWLTRNGPLTPEEWTMIHHHPDNGADGLRRFGEIAGEPYLLELAAEIAESHHERYDGSGYPRGLKGEDIPLSARIVAVADVFIAMTSPRPWRPPHDEESVRQHIREGAGTLYDPHVVSAFLDLDRY